MKVQHAPTAMTASCERTSSVRLQGRWLLLARGLWITLEIFFASLPMYTAQLQTICTGTYGSQLPATLS
jgi:hypothetical protein